MIASVEPTCPVICIAGPTGAGKSRIALMLAERLGGVIVNADSRQVYRDFPLITAQPSAAEHALARHTLYGFLDTRESISAGRWAEMAGQTVRAVLAEGRLPILVGGTGLYLRALLDGMADIPPVPRHTHEALIQMCRSQGLASLYERLHHVDPVCAARIHPHDRQRILRALEVFEATGKALSWWQANRQQPGAPWPVLRLGIGMDLAALTPLLARRIETMLEAGAIEEAERARTRCDDPRTPGWSGIGCVELYAYLTGTLDAVQLRRVWLANTRAYAKRQLTWFRADKRLEWFAPDALPAVLSRVRAWLDAPDGTR